MRILSRSTDYFDFSGMGVDTDVTFARDAQHPGHLTADHASDLAATFPRGTVDALDLPSFSRFSYRDPEHGWSALSLDPGFVLVGGVGFPCVRVTLSYDWSDSPVVDRRWAFDADSLRAILVGYVRRAGRSYDESRFVRAMDPVFAKGRHDLTPYALALGAVTGVLLAEQRLRRQTSSYTYEPVLLKETGIQDLLPPHEAHMMVSRFVGGVMAHNPPTDPLSNKDRIVKAGFDLVTSFRKGRATPSKA